MAVAASEAGLEGANLWRTAVLATAVVALHATANLVNTVVDFSKGVDQGAEADDRTLVDGLVSEGQLRAVAWLSALIGGAASSAFVAESLGVDMAGVLGSRPAAAGRGEEVALTLAALLASGLCLAVLYTAGPCGLKYRGLGELTVFACFGPLLGAAASLALTGTLSDDCLLASVPFGAVAVAVLHSNNVRDADADGRAGAFTLAQALGARLNALLYTLALWTAAGAAVLACASAAARRAGLADAGVPPRFGSASLHAASRCLTGQSPCPGFWPQAAHGLMLLAMCAPWAVSLTSRLSRGSLRFLPQLTAQWGTLLGGALLAGIAAPAAAGRGLLAVLFMLGGVNNVVMWTHSVSRACACEGPRRGRWAKGLGNETVPPPLLPGARFLPRRPLWSLPRCAKPPGWLCPGGSAAHVRPRPPRCRLAPVPRSASEFSLVRRPPCFWYSWRQSLRWSTTCGPTGSPPVIRQLQRGARRRRRAILTRPRQPSPLLLAATATAKRCSWCDTVALRRPAVVAGATTTPRRFPPAPRRPKATRSPPRCPRERAACPRSSTRLLPSLFTSSRTSEWQAACSCS